jgi:hypothetical protein
MFSKINHIKLSNKITIIALVGSLLVNVYTISRNYQLDHKNDELEYKNKSLQYRPILEIVGAPQIIGYHLTGKKVAIKDILIPKDSSNRVVDYPADLSVTLRFNVTNVGNSMAKLYLVAHTDTLSTEDRLRDIILGNYQATIKSDTAKKSDFSASEIKNTDTTYYDFDIPVQYADTAFFTIHLLFLYKNEADIFYDTYYWAKYIMNPLYLEPQVAMVNNKPFMRFAAQKEELNNFLKYSEKKSTYKIYSKEESEKVLKYLKNAS